MSQTFTGQIEAISLLLILAVKLRSQAFQSNCVSPSETDVGRREQIEAGDEVHTNANIFIFEASSRMCHF